MDNYGHVLFIVVLYLTDGVVYMKERHTDVLFVIATSTKQKHLTVTMDLRGAVAFRGQLGGWWFS